jgi:protein involved in polysaccharide export with SLBB domain
MGVVRVTSRHGYLAVLTGAILGLVASGCGPAFTYEKFRAFLQEPRAPVSGTEYRVLPPDVITVTSRHVPEVNNVTQQVRPDGKVNLPLLGEIYVATATAREYYEQVDATVTVSQYRSQMIYIFGQVSRPGPRPWTGTDTLLDVLAQSQPTQLAWPERIKIVRLAKPKRGGYLSDKEYKKALNQAKGAAEGKGPQGPTEMTSREETKSVVIMVDMMKMVQKGDASRNVMLQADDVVYVPPNPLAAVGLAIQQLLFPIRPGAEMISMPASAVNTASMVGGT